MAVGDVVSIDLSATVDGEDAPPNAAAEDSGSGRLIAVSTTRLLVIRRRGRVFTAKLAAGEHAGRKLRVTVTVRSVRGANHQEATTNSAQLASRVRQHRRIAGQPQLTRCARPSAQQAG